MSRTSSGVPPTVLNSSPHLATSRESRSRFARSYSARTRNPASNTMIAGTKPAITFEPPWTPEMMSDDAKFILGFG